MKTCCITALVCLLTHSLMAQTIPADTSKQTVLYFDLDSTRMTKPAFVDKVNNGKYTIAITNKGNKTYMYITPAQKVRRKEEVERAQPRH